MSDRSSSSEDSGGDINVPADQLNDFFFMDQDEEQEKYGASTKIPDALSGNVLKDASQQKVSFTWSENNVAFWIW